MTAELPAHRIVVLRGASGSGKSTLLRLCNRLEIPTSGQVAVEQRNLDQWDVVALRRRVGMVFQRPVLFPGTVWDNLRSGAPNLGRERAIELLNQAALSPSYLDRIGDDLSGGEAQRVCLARALAVQPIALLMDEPTSALDDDSTRSIETFARRFVDDGGSVIWVTHDSAQAARLADVTLRVEHGRLLG